MNTFLKLVFGFILVMILSTATYGIKFSTTQVKIVHDDIVSGIYNKCFGAGNDSATCQCASKMIGNRLNDASLESCDFHSKAEFMSCVIAFTGKGADTSATIALCKKNPYAAGSASATTNSPSSSNSMMRILLLIVSVIALLWLIKSTFLNKS